jgi:hypothetical protein
MNYNIKPSLFLSLFFILILTSCGPNTIEQQVDEIITTTKKEDITKIAYSLADSLNTKAFKLLIELHPKKTKKIDGSTDYKAITTEQKVRWALQGIISRYSEITNPKIENCLSYITDPNLEHNLSDNKKIALIIYGLGLNNTSQQFQTILANSAVRHNSNGMLKLIEDWEQNKNSQELLYAIKLFDQKVLNYLGGLIVDDVNAVDLLARIGEPAIRLMKQKMRSNKQSVRFAAGDVLVKMIEYHPNALISLTSAINKNGIKTIARNYPFYIRLGQAGSEQILLKALRLNFSTSMCVDYLNCGSKTIEDGATKIARDNGYIVTPELGNHTGPRWGSEN